MVDRLVALVDRSTAFVVIYWSEPINRYMFLYFSPRGECLAQDYRNVDDSFAEAIIQWSKVSKFNTIWTT